jgi:hypothetical protein
VQDPARMLFLVLPSGAGADLVYRREQDNTITPANIVRSPAKLVDMLVYVTRVSPPALVFELVNPAHELACWLARAPVIRRGRP